ncbi:MAG: ATP-binding protein [Candidatus Bathyarchaeota archaeon]|nr:ATP-binding protein [Candidatus Bathyarchaeota archaeon]MDH5788617.1 ATP-binding protein [Candidatus Bathyarchaeota archaeon]
MKQLTILSGKGGTGKTTITASFAVLARNAVVADCDVDAPDLHILLHPKIVKTQEFRGSKLATINETKCTKCDLCREKCNFNAITENLQIDPISCEGCGVCSLVCQVSAITLTERVSGHAYISETKYGFMAHALLNPGESNSGKLVTLVRQNAKVLAEKEHADLVIIDGSPGIGCPVIASVTGVDAGLIVTEPTMSGIHDLERVLRLLGHFNVRPFVCINMHDINDENTKRIVDFCGENGVEVIGKIPFNPIATEAMVNEKPIVEYASESRIAKKIIEMWKRTVSALKCGSQ